MSFCVFQPSPKCVGRWGGGIRCRRRPASATASLGIVWSVRQRNPDWWERSLKTNWLTPSPSLRPPPAPTRRSGDWAAQRGRQRRRHRRHRKLRRRKSLSNGLVGGPEPTENLERRPLYYPTTTATTTTTGQWRAMRTRATRSSAISPTGPSTGLKRANIFRKISTRTSARISFTRSDGWRKANWARWRPTTNLWTARSASTSAWCPSKTATPTSRSCSLSVSTTFRFFTYFFRM